MTCLSRLRDNIRSLPYLQTYTHTQTPYLTAQLVGRPTSTSTATVYWQTASRKRIHQQQRCLKQRKRQVKQSIGGPYAYSSSLYRFLYYRKLLLSSQLSYIVISYWLAHCLLLYRVLFATVFLTFYSLL